MSMVQNRRVSSFSRGFGITVIATERDTEKIEARTEDTDSCSNENQNENIGHHADISTTDMSELEDVDVSIVSESTLADVQANTDNQVDDMSELETPVDVSLSPSNLRHKSFNSHSKKQKNDGIKERQPLPPLTQQKQVENQNQNINKTLAMSQRFRSTPSFHSPPSITSSPIINSKSNTSSPYLPQSRQQLPGRYPRRQSYQLTKKQKYKLYDDDEDTFADTDQDLFMYNVPIASATSLRMFQNGNAMQSREALRKAWNESESNLIIPPSPLPGNLTDSSTFGSSIDLQNDSIVPPPIPRGQSAMPNRSTKHRPVTTENGTGSSIQPFESPFLKKNASFNALSPTAQQLSTFYEFTSHNDAEEEFRKRRQQTTPSTADPELVNALDDLSMASSEKLSKLSVTRPSWIPPKEQSELHRHEREFKKMIERTSKEALKQSKHQIKIEHDRTIGDARLAHLSQKISLSSNNCSEVRKYILVTNIDENTKFMIFRKMMTHKLGSNILLSPPFQKVEGNGDDQTNDSENLNFVSLLGSQKLTEIEESSLRTILQPIASPAPSTSVDVNKLSPIPALPLQTLLSRLTKISLSLLKSGYTTPQIRDMIYWLHSNIMTVKFKEDFTKLLSRHSALKLFKEFKDDYSILTLPTSLDLILDLSEVIVTKCVELLIVFWTIGSERGVRIFMSIIVCIVRDYHFGWNNLQMIFQSKAHVNIGTGVSDSEKFFSRVLGYYNQLK